MRNHFVIVLMVGSLFPVRTFSQLTPVPLEQRIDKSAFIIEGKVTSKVSLWDNEHHQIYTINTISLYKSFKGYKLPSEIEIITQGGIVGDRMEEVSHSLQLNVGDIGVFTIIPNKISLPQTKNLERFKTYAGLQGFIHYDLSTHTASDPFKHYKNISTDLYSVITSRTKTKMVTIKKADFKIQ
jgi:hypothetical protein